MCARFLPFSDSIHSKDNLEHRLKEILLFTRGELVERGKFGRSIVAGKKHSSQENGHPCGNRNQLNHRLAYLIIKLVSPI